MKKKTSIKKYITLGIIVLVVIALILIPVAMNAIQEEMENKASILSTEAEMNSIETTLSGAGVIKETDAVDISVPSGVEITQYLVSNGDTVKTGDSLATVDRVSVMNAVSEVQSTMDALAKKIEKSRKETDGETITIKTPGRVKKIFVSQGEDVTDVMRRDGALALLSLDGKMCVTVECKTALISGDTVTVQRENGERVKGTVESNAAGKITVTISDENADYEEEVKIFDRDGKELGAGGLKIHSEWKATAIKGTVNRIFVKENEKVKSGAKLLKLEDTGYSAEFELLTAQYRVYQDIMQELFTLYQTQTVYAKESGTVHGIDEDNILKVSAGTGGGEWMLLAGEPEGDEGQYVNHAGTVSGIGYGSFSMKMQLGSLEITDYKDIHLNPDLMIADNQIEPPVSTPVYALQEGEWVQKGLGEIKVGDMLVISYADETQAPVWIIIAGHDSRYDGGGGGRFPGGGGSWKDLFGSLYGNKQQEEELYSKAKTKIMDITPMQEVTVDITIDELDILKVRNGQSASVSVDALPGQTFNGKVSKLNTSGSNQGGNSKFTVEITLDRTDKMLGGMNASVIIVLGEKKDILTLPVQALQDIGKETYVYTSYDEKKGFGGLTKVETGVSDGTNVEITGGLSEGQTVWYEYYDKLQINQMLDNLTMQ